MKSEGAGGHVCSPLEEGGHAPRVLLTSKLHALHLKQKDLQTFASLHVLADLVAGRNNTGERKDLPIGYQTIPLISLVAPRVLLTSKLHALHLK